MSTEAPINNAATTAAAAPAAPVTTAAPATAATSFDTVEDGELRGYAANKGWADAQTGKLTKPIGELLKSYRENEQIRHVPANELVRMPKPDAQEAEWQAFYDRMGRPKQVSEYKLPELQPGEQMDEEFVNHMLPRLHKAGLNQNQVAEAANAWTEYIRNQMAAMDQEESTQQQAELQGLKREWPGQTYTEREELARRYVRQIVVPALGLKDDNETGELLNSIEGAIGTAKFLKLFAHAGETLGEGRFVDSSTRPQTGFGMTPQQAQAKLNELQKDAEFNRRWLKAGKGSAEDEQINSLSRIASGGRA